MCVLAGRPASPPSEPQAAQQQPAAQQQQPAPQPPPARIIQRPAYPPNAANEDWSALKDPANRTDFWDWAKYIPFGGGDGFITLSAEIRYRPEGFRLKGSETIPHVRDNYFLQRYLFGADVRFGPRVRFFTEFQSGIINGKIGATRPTDQNTFDLHQAFFEWRRPSRAGQTVQSPHRPPGADDRQQPPHLRQPGLNTKRSFDGARLVFGRGTWTVESAAALLTETEPGRARRRSAQGREVLGRGRGPAQPAVGEGAAGPLLPGPRERQRPVRTGPGTRPAEHVRHVLAGIGPPDRPQLRPDLPGRLVRGRGRAGVGGLDRDGIRVSAGPGGRRALSVRFNSASGDHDAADPRLQSFNPLFPGSSYAGIVGLFGPTNMTDVTPSITVTPRHNLILGFEQPNFWRSSAGDGLYNVNLQLLVRPTAGTGRYVGSSFNIFTVWQATRHVQITGAVMRMQSGGFLEKTIAGKGLGLYSISTIYRF